LLSWIQMFSLQRCLKNHQVYVHRPERDKFIQPYNGTRIPAILIISVFKFVDPGVIYRHCLTCKGHEKKNNLDIVSRWTSDMKVVTDLKLFSRRSSWETNAGIIFSLADNPVEIQPCYRSLSHSVFVPFRGAWWIRSKHHSATLLITIGFVRNDNLERYVGLPVRNNSRAVKWMFMKLQIDFGILFRLVYNVQFRLKSDKITDILYEDLHASLRHISEV
jgi:hypothetical protein